MSIPTFRQAYAFFTPVSRRSVALMVDDSIGHEAASGFLLSCLSTLKKRTIVLDGSAFFGIRAISIGERLEGRFLGDVELRLPVSDPIQTLTASMSPNADVIIIDDVNSLNHLISRRLGKHGFQRLFSLMKLLTFSGIENGLTVFAIFHDSERTNDARQGGRRSLSSTFGLQVAVENTRSEIKFNCRFGSAWPSGSFAVKI